MMRRNSNTMVATASIEVHVCFISAGIMYSTNASTILKVSIKRFLKRNLADVGMDQ